MDQAILTVLIAGMLPVVCAGIAKWGDRSYDNRDPRAWLARQQGMRQRANAAQHNSFEAFPFFAAGVALALIGGADRAAIDLTCWFFIAMRVVYIGLYLADRAAFRSIVWILGYGAVIRLYLLAI